MNGESVSGDTVTVKTGFLLQSSERCLKGLVYLSIRVVLCLSKICPISFKHVPVPPFIYSSVPFVKVGYLASCYASHVIFG